MRLGRLRRSRNVEDRRGGRRLAGRTGGGLGLGAIIIIVLAMLFPDLRQPLMGMLSGGQEPGRSQSAGEGVDDSHRAFAEAVLGSAEDVWKDALGSRYREPRMVLFSGSESTRCGMGSASAGPFYCPADKTIYIDPAFYDIMAQRLRAGGDFAQAYVIAHEFAHYVQDLLGAVGEVDRNRRLAGRGTPEANRWTVRLELQADCYSGVWAKRAETRWGVLESGDLEEALNAAARIGDDALGIHDPEAYTHGSSAQRVKWLQTGWRSGDPAACDTFSQPYDRL